MYNLLNRADLDGWKELSYECDLKRFGEWTSPDLFKKYQSLSSAAVAELKSFPCLFMYEGVRAPARLGRLLNVKLRSGTVFIEFEFLKGTKPVPATLIDKHKLQLDIGEWEMNRTHWAIKDEVLFERLSKAGYDISKAKSIWKRSTRSGPSHGKDYDVALSFAGEERKYVEAVAKLLQTRGIKIFYDKEEEITLWGKNLYEYLSELYQNRARFSVMFISKSYASKEWTRLEREAMQARLLTDNSGYVLPARFDDTKIPGLSRTIGYIDLAGKNPRDLADLIEKKLEAE